MKDSVKELLTVIAVTFLVGGLMHVASKLEKEIRIDEILKKED